LTSSGSKIEDAKDKAYRFLSYRARSVAEVRERLLQKGFDRDVIEKVLIRLKELKLLDDEDFALKFATDLVSIKGCGRFLVAQKLRQKGIGEERVKRVLDKVFSDIDEKETARRLAKKKIKNRIDSPRERSRIGRHLQSKGYSWEIIQEVLKDFDEGQ
jgi:regulatory protein